MKNNKRDIIIIMIIGIVIILSAVFCILIFKNNKTNEVSSENDLIIAENDVDSFETEELIDIEENVVATETITSNENEVISQENNTQPTQSNNNQTNKTNNKSNSSSSSTNNNNSSDTKTPSVPSNPSQTPTTPSEPSTPIPERCTNNNNHGIGIGNCNKWYVNKSDGIAEYNSQLYYWDQQLNNGEITWEEYGKKCPSGYECWTCMFCGKWTFNYYYR